jgi:hypothetical protein
MHTFCENIAKIYINLPLPLTRTQSSITIYIDQWTEVVPLFCLILIWGTGYESAPAEQISAAIFLLFQFEYRIFHFHQRN